MTTYFPPLLQTARAEGYARPWTVKAELLPQHQRALHELQTDPDFIAHLQWMQHNIPEFAWIDPHNPSTYSLKFLQEADGTVRINVKANPTDIGKHIPVEHRFGLLHQYAAFLLDVGPYPVRAPASPTPPLSPQLSPRAVSPRGTPSPAPSTDDEEERPRRLSPEFEAMQQTVRDQQAQIAEQGRLVLQLTQFIQAQAEQNQKSHAEQLDALQKANADAIRELKAAHASSMEQFQRMRDDSREDLLAAMGDMQRQYQTELEQLEHQRTDLAGQIDALRDEHREAIQTFRQDRDAQLDRMERQHTATLRAFRDDRDAQVQQMTDQHAAQMQAQREQQAASEERFKQALTDLGEQSDQRLADAQRHSEQLVQQVTQDAGRWRRTLLRQSTEHRQEVAQQFAAYREDLNARFEELRELFENLHPAPSLEALSVPASPRDSRSATPELDEPADDGQGLAASPPPADHAPHAQERELVQEFSEENARLYTENMRLQNVALQFQVLSERVPQLEEQIRNLEQIRTRYSEAERLVGQLAPMEQELRTLRIFIGQKDSDIRQLGDALRNLELRASEALRQAEHYRAQVERLELQIAQLRDQAPDQSALEHLQTQLERQQQLRQQAEAQAERLQDINRRLEQRISQQDETIMESDRRRDEAIEDLAAAEADFAEQREQLAAQMAETRQEWLAQMRDLQTARDEALERVDGLEQEIAAHIFGREAAESDLAATEQENALLQRQLRQARSLLALQEGHLERLEATTAQLTFMLLAGQSWLQRLHQPFAPREFRPAPPRPLPRIELQVPEAPPSQPIVREPPVSEPPFDPSFDDLAPLFHYHIPRPLSDSTPRPLAPAPFSIFPGLYTLPRDGSPFRMPLSFVGSQMLLNGSSQRLPRQFPGITPWLYQRPLQQPGPAAEPSFDLSNVILTGDSIDDGVSLYRELGRQRTEAASVAAELEDGTQLQPLIRNPPFNLFQSAPGQYGIFSHLLRQPPANPVPQSSAPRIPTVSGSRNPPSMPNSFFWGRQSQQAAPQQPGLTGPSIDAYSRLLHQHLMNRRQPPQSATAPVQQTPPPRAFRFSPPVVTDTSDLAPDLHAFAQRPSPSPQQQTPPASRSFSSEDFAFWFN